ncbi:hypothetical protein VSR69_36470 [Paraburkholderia phytofirmans]|uniref:hypothetical protein n=1 Tax=Paraburkholderia sp. BL9I2N2 TaxID=1938809 RepID=UPI001404F43F|nr:hypothetical protein [Paraburkholderia sp. BL9I2N2]
MDMLLSYIAGHLGTTLDTLLAGIQSNPSFLKAFSANAYAGSYGVFESGQVREAA